MIFRCKNCGGNIVYSPEKRKMCCPHCGAASTLGELEDGCEYCGTKFVMSELYPKVSNFFITRHEDRTERYNKNKREAAIFMAACIIPLIIMSFILGDQLVMRLAGAFVGAQRDHQKANSGAKLLLAEREHPVLRRIHFGGGFGDRSFLDYTKVLA